MFGLNTYLSTASARDVVDQLFGRGHKPVAELPGPSAFQPLSYDAETGTTASQRALANIIAIIYNMQHQAVEHEAVVSEESGHITAASGTEDADKLDMKASSAFNISTGGGDDTITVKADTLALLNGGSGNDTMNLAASYISDVDGGDGDDTIRMTGDLALGVAGGAGNDTIKISTETMLGIDGGDGDDTLHLEGNRIFASGGAGNDTITIRNTGGEPAELSFVKGDGRDAIGTNGPIDIRFAYPAIFGTGTTSFAFAPDDLDVSVSEGRLVIKSRLSDDAITVDFDAGALEQGIPKFTFEMDQGDYVLKVR
ncbi:MAG: rzcA [Rhizobium sp.]|nr:rzcA [Rhizobium sp.]